MIDTAETTAAKPPVKQPKFFAWVWQKVRDMMVATWTKGGQVEEIQLTVPENTPPAAKQAEAMRQRASLLKQVGDGDAVVMEMGGVGDMAALMAYHNKAQVMRVPTKFLKDARDQAKTDKDQDHLLLQSLYAAKPELFYRMTPRDEQVARLKIQIGWLYDIQRRIRIPTQLRLISIFRDELLLNMVMEGKDPSVIPTVRQIAAEVMDEETLEEALGSEEDKESAQKIAAIRHYRQFEPGNDVGGESDEQAEAKADKPKAKRKPSLPPETLKILEDLKKRLADDPNLKAAVEQEQAMEKKIAAILKDLDVYKQVFEPIECIGPRTGGRLIGFLNTPARFQGKSVFHSCGQFQAFCGWTVAPDGRAQRKRRDVRQNFNPEVKQALYIWVSLINKRLKSPWRRWMDDVKLSIRNGWVIEGKQLPGYAEGRMLAIMKDQAEVARFVEDKDLRRRVNKALAEVLGEEQAKEFKRNTKDVNDKLVAYLASPENAETAKRIWLHVFNPDEWKSHILKKAYRKMIKYLLMYIFHTWSRLEGLPYEQKVIDWVEGQLKKYTPPAEPEK